MYCKNCGKEIAEGSSFCKECGWKVGSQVSNDNNTYNTSINSSSTNKNISKIPIKIILPAVALVIILIGILAFGNKKCAHGGCDEKVYKEGLCREHYASLVAAENTKDVLSGEKDIWEAAGDVYDKVYKEEKKTKDKSVCKEDGCYQPVFQSGLCKEHYAAKNLSKIFGIGDD